MPLSLTGPTDQSANSLPMRMLAAGVPLTLLMDLAEAFGPPSASIMTEERGDAAWLPPFLGPRVAA